MSRKSIINKSSSFLSSPMFLLGGVVLFVFFGWAALNEYLRERAIDAEVNELKQTIADLESKNGELKSSLSYIQTPEFQELEAKRQLGLVKDGENVIIFSDKSSGKSTLSDSETDDKDAPQLSNPQKWWNYFFIE
ncbi:septum formation initiator family protein [Patescibacteria group bacterium]|nr:MAG: septum formation initiator family protein [Patescibacteria group bacterium]